MEKSLRKKAKDKVEAKHAFHIVAAVFASISSILYIISLNFGTPVAYWIQFPILVLAMVLGIIYVSMFGISLHNPFNSRWKEEEIEKEMARLSFENTLRMQGKPSLVQEEDNEWIEAESIHYGEWNN